MGTTQDIPRVSELLDVDEVVIAIPSATGNVIRKISEICREAKVDYKVLPGVYHILTSQAYILSPIRDARLSDFLKRRPIAIDRASVRRYISAKTILITGAAGSIGSELVWQIGSLGPKQIVAIDRSENELAGLLWDLEIREAKFNLVPVIADLQDEQKLDDTMEKYTPEVVFHAAAFKHVSFMEMYPEEAVKNNIIGSRNLLDAAVKHSTRHLVAISTDKAVNPICVMGASKRVMELLIAEYARTNPSTSFSAVRFGNVFNSNGSVIRIFRKQIDYGGPLTVTHPEVERYFMSIAEATQLVIQAGAFAKGGELYVLDMGEQIRILDIAREMCSMRGLELNEDIKVVFTGLRPGEKISEELVASRETTESTKSDLIFQITCKHSSDWTSMREDLDAFQDLAKSGNRAGIYAALKRIVPEYNR